MDRPFWLQLAVGVGVVGFVLSLAVHVAAWAGAEVPPVAFALHVGVFAAFAPVVFALKAWAEGLGHDLGASRGRWGLANDLFGLFSRWERLVFGALLAYTTANVFVALPSASDGPSVRLFSGHWMYFYAVSAMLARRLLAVGARAARGGRGR